LINSKYGGIKSIMREKTKWVKPSLTEFKSAKAFIQGAGEIDGVKKEIGTPTDSAFANSIISPS
tara:strand:+ start:13 stop:204 length:192 start_codon:yes stop_codon:yes gene_type:complete